MRTPAEKRLGENNFFSFDIFFANISETPMPLCTRKGVTDKCGLLLNTMSAALALADASASYSDTRDL
jgi:hypothetical protein